MSRSQVQLDVWLITSEAADEIDYQTLLWIGEELFVVTAFEVLIQRGRGVKIRSATPSHPHNQKMLPFGDTTLLIVNDFAIAVKG